MMGCLADDEAMDMDYPKIDTSLDDKDVTR